MKRAVLFSSVACVLAGMAAPVLAAPAVDSADKVLSECGSNVPPELIDSCLERARVLDEAEPSPALESLEARLEQQEKVGGKPAHAYAAPSDGGGAPPPGSGSYGNGSYGGDAYGSGHAASGSPRDIAPGHPRALPPPQGYDRSGERSGSAPREESPRDDGPPPDNSTNYGAPPPDADMPPDSGPPPDADMPPPNYGPGDQGPPPDADMPPPEDRAPPPPRHDRDAHPYNPTPQEPDNYDRGGPDEDDVVPDERGPRDDDFDRDEPPVDDSGPPYPR